jgi:hypothetical protein
MPTRILDLYVEYKAQINGRDGRARLIDALAAHGLDSITATEKSEMIGLALRGGHYTDDERVALLDYCESDVDALARLLPKMARRIDLPRALLRGRYMAAVAMMMHHGVPIDRPTLGLLREHWEAIQDQLIARIDTRYRVYDGRSFRTAALSRWLANAGIPWPRLESGHLDLSDDTFSQMARAHPSVAPLRELRSALSKFRLAKLSVGKDGRNRTSLFPFSSVTGRNQPSNASSIFGLSCWQRGLILAPPGCAVVYMDWDQQEFGIAGALSGDGLMQEAYLSGDCYLAFARQAGAVPPDATKESHPTERELFKQTVLGVQYGMTAYGLADRIGGSPSLGHDLIRVHLETYRPFWRWSDCAVDQAMLTGELRTVFGWPVHVCPKIDKRRPEAGLIVNPRSLRNFPMQANGAEMLRLACCLATERGVEVCMPVHDAIMVLAPIGDVENTIEMVRSAMAEASRTVLGGFELRTGIHPPVFAHPQRYMDKRGEVFWNEVIRLAAETGHPRIYADDLRTCAETSGIFA